MSKSFIREFLILYIFFSDTTLANISKEAQQLVDQINEDSLNLSDLLNLEVITATKTTQNLSDTPSTMSVITEEDIEYYGWSTLPEALAHIPELYTRYEGHNWSTDFRGYFTNNNRRQTLYLLNGHKINDRFHFGDFYPDIISDLKNIHRIEVIRGPGAAIYGNWAITGVVNIITKKFDELKSRPSIFEADFVAEDLMPFKKGIDSSFTHKWRLAYRTKFSGNQSFSLNTYWFTGNIDYDAGNNWKSPYGDGNSVKTIKETSQYFSVGHKANFEGGKQIPSFEIDYKYLDLTLSLFNHSKRVNWIPPKDTATFGHPDNDRQWGTSGIVLDWTPSEGVLNNLEFKTRISYNMNTNSEIADYATDVTRVDTGLSLFLDRLRDRVFLSSENSTQQYINGILQNYRSYISTQQSNFSDAVANSKGGGAQFVYYGIDKTFAAEFQLTPYKSSNVHWSIGTNFEKADYENSQYFRYRNGEFIGWAPWGGISDEGWYTGVYTQLLYGVTEFFTISAGLRYDFQKVDKVERQLGGNVRIDSSGNNVELNDKTSDNLTPRISLNYRFSPRNNLRLIYAQAFRSVPPQELIRLDFGLKADSETVKDYEVIYSHQLSNHINFDLNFFYMDSNIAYSWNPSTASFSKIDDGWSVKGASLELKTNYEYFSYWFNTTLMNHTRTANASEDSPEMMLKAGGLYHFNKSSLSFELFHLGSTKQVVSGDQNAGDTGNSNSFRENIVDQTTFTNIVFRHQFSKSYDVTFKINNIFDSQVDYAIPTESQNWDKYTYTKPNSLPGLGRTIYLELSYRN
ncbi:MAG: TonB-dependent receptor [Halobacteriovoraceae bacterium]|nr:TonB-dependent receptor [Halobacteriovoraceae bacterium]